MERVIVILMAASLGACASLTGQGDSAETLRTLGEHIDRCERHYQGGVGVGASFTFSIDCKGEAGSAPGVQSEGQSR